jgi:hypothetical protein
VRASGYAIRAVVRTIPSSTKDAFVRDPTRGEERRSTPERYGYGSACVTQIKTPPKSPVGKGQES